MAKEAGIMVYIQRCEEVSPPIVAKIASEFAEYLETIGWEIVPKKGYAGAGIDYEELAAEFVQHIQDEHGRAGQLR